VEGIQGEIIDFFLEPGRVIVQDVDTCHFPSPSPAPITTGHSHSPSLLPAAVPSIPTAEAAATISEAVAVERRADFPAALILLNVPWYVWCVQEGGRGGGGGGGLN
jgi:hypothetical protein